MRFSQAWKAGRAGEEQARSWLMEGGWYVVPMADINSSRQRAPMLEGKVASIVLPDLAVYGKGIQRWVEVKTKRQASYTRALHRYEHGVELPNWEAYMRCEVESGAEGWLCILEQEPVPLLLLASCASLDRVKRVYRGEAMAHGRGMAFFPRDTFDVYPGPSDKPNHGPIRMPPVEAARTLSDGMPAPQLSLFNTWK